MTLIKDLSEAINIRDAVVTIGNFDGLHLGHQKIFETLKAKAREIGGTPVVITFDPHPMKVLAHDRDIKMITTLDDKVSLLEDAGIGAVVVIGFNRAFASTEAEEFIQDILVDKLKIKAIIVGHGYVFGKAKKGNTELLRRRGRRFGFEVHVVRFKKVGQSTASSSRIRSLISKGRVRDAARMLGRAYHINGTVVSGTGRGKGVLDIPTANIDTTNELIPPEGVYAVRVTFNNDPEGQIKDTRIYDGVANIGSNPTFKNTFLSYEVHIFDFTGHILGCKMRVHFIKRIREEICFPDVDSLRMQIIKDIEAARVILKEDTQRIFVE